MAIVRHIVANSNAAGLLENWNGYLSCLRCLRVVLAMDMEMKMKNGVVAFVLFARLQLALLIIQSIAK